MRIEGRVEKVPRAASEEYFTSRPYHSKISASISHQSTVIPNREVSVLLTVYVVFLY